MNNNTYPIAYACYNKDLDIRLQSTSGGIFTVLAKYVIEELHGVVFGAAFDDHFAVRHDMVASVEELEKLRGSKYPQSNVGLCFRRVRDELEKGTIVLFTGTPCQVAGLHRFLSKRFENLLCIDFVCHGVASPGLWRDYLAECRDVENIKNIVFKDKARGWKRWYVKIQYDTHTWYRRGIMEPFMVSYLTYANIRPSCYQCCFKGIVHESDFTISDCWGIGEENKRLNDNKGLSALLIQNENAERIFERICSKIVYEEYVPDDLMEGNWTAYRSVVAHPKRKAFFETYRIKGAKKALDHYFVPDLKRWVEYYYLRMIGKEK